MLHVKKKKVKIFRINFTYGICNIKKNIIDEY